MKDVPQPGYTKKQKQKAAFLGITVICLAYLSYTMIIPMSELSVTTTVHYSFSGISVGLQIQNTGTIEMTETTLNITVLDEDGDVEYSEWVDIGSFASGERIVHSFSFSAPFVDTYHLYLNFTYRCDGQDYDESAEHVMEDYMNFVWKDKFRDWRI